MLNISLIFLLNIHTPFFAFFIESRSPSACLGSVAGAQCIVLWCVQDPSWLESVWQSLAMTPCSLLTLRILILLISYLILHSKQRSLNPLLLIPEAFADSALILRATGSDHTALVPGFLSGVAAGSPHHHSTWTHETNTGQEVQTHNRPSSSVLHPWGNKLLVTVHHDRQVESSSNQSGVVVLTWWPYDLLADLKLDLQNTGMTRFFRSGPNDSEEETGSSVLGSKSPDHKSRWPLLVWLSFAHTVQWES